MSRKTKRCTNGETYTNALVSESWDLCSKHTYHIIIHTYLSLSLSLSLSLCVCVCVCVWINLLSLAVCVCVCVPLVIHKSALFSSYNKDERQKQSKWNLNWRDDTYTQNEYKNQQLTSHQNAGSLNICKCQKTRNNESLMNFDKTWTAWIIEGREDYMDEWTILSLCSPPYNLIQITISISSQCYKTLRKKKKERTRDLTIWGDFWKYVCIIQKKKISIGLTQRLDTKTKTSEKLWFKKERRK
jgi:hypothetical protein